jgi:hypothetical protein
MYYKSTYTSQTNLFLLIIMTTMTLAKEKWARKMRDAGAKWKAGVSGKEGAYRDGLARLSGTVGSTMPSHWAEGVDAVSADEFGRAVAGKEDKWASKLAEAIAS